MWLGINVVLLSSSRNEMEILRLSYTYSPFLPSYTHKSSRGENSIRKNVIYKAKKHQILGAHSARGRENLDYRGMRRALKVWHQKNSWGRGEWIWEK